MQCFTPYRVRQKSKDWQNQNLMVNVPCGKCLACKKRRASHWSFRLNEEAKTSSSACFITLTYEKAPISENGFQTLVKKDYQLFLKRLRKKGQSIALESANPAYETRTFPHEKIKVQGRLVGLLRTY